jgi:hypothetical protein
MSIADYHFYHGAALSILVSQSDFTGLSRIPDLGNAYAVNNMTGLYIKRATADNSPWLFNFHPEHQTDIRNLFQRFNEKTFIALVCGKTGICLLQYGSYANVLEEDFNNQKTLTIKRPQSGGFRVVGQNQQLKGVVPIKNYPDGLFNSK